MSSLLRPISMEAGSWSDRALVLSTTPVPGRLSISDNSW